MSLFVILFTSKVIYETVKDKYDNRKATKAQPQIQDHHQSQLAYDTSISSITLPNHHQSQTNGSQVPEYPANLGTDEKCDFLVSVAELGGQQDQHPALRSRVNIDMDAGVDVSGEMEMPPPVYEHRAADDIRGEREPREVVPAYSSLQMHV